MADTDDQKLLKDFADKIRGQNAPMFEQKSGRNEDDRHIEDISKSVDAFAKGNLRHQKDILKILQKSFKDMGLKDEISRIEDALRAADQPEAMREIADRLDAIGTKNFASKQALDEELAGLSDIAEEAGLTLDDLGVKTTAFHSFEFNQKRHIINDQKKTSEKITERANKMTIAMANAEREMARYTERVAFAKDMMGKFGGVVKNITKDFLRLAEQEQRFAQQNATADAGWIEGIETMGVSQLDYMKTLKATRVENLAMTGAGLSFKDSLVASQQSLVGFTASTTEALQVSQSFHKSMARIGVKQENLGDAVLQQSQIYKDHYRVLGYSADEFAKLTEELINDQGMRSVLLGLQEKERKAYILGVQQRMAEYQTMGFTIERAKELQKTFQALNAMNPKERMKQAAKTRAMMGAMGMGAEGAELFDLQTRYRTMSADEKEKADIRMTQIQSKAAGKFGEQSGSGSSLGQSMAFQMMADKTGFSQIAEKFETASGEGLKVDAQQLLEMKAQRKNTNEISNASKAILKGVDYYGAAANSSLGSLVTNSTAILASLVVASAAGGLVGKYARSGTGLGGAAGMGAGSLAKLVPLVGAAMVGVEIGNVITDAWKANFTEGYASFAEGLGTGIDHIADFFGSDDAAKRLENAEKMDELRAKQLAATEETNRLAQEQNDKLDAMAANQAEGTDKQVAATDKQTSVQSDATRVGRAQVGRGSN